MNVLKSSMLFAFLIMFEVEQIAARYEGVKYISDPVQLLVQGGYSSLQNGNYIPIKQPYRQEKHPYSLFLPPFYNKFDFHDIPINRRYRSPMYTDLLFSGR